MAKKLRRPKRVARPKAKAVKAASRPAAKKAKASRKAAPARKAKVAKVAKKAAPAKKATAPKSAAAPTKAAGPRKGTGKAVDAEALAKSGSVKLAAKKFAEALVDFERALAAVPDHLYALYGAAFCLGVLARQKKGAEHTAMTDRVIDLARRLVAKTPESSLWPYLAEHKFPRETLRFAYNALAWYGMERARSAEDLENALAGIDHGLSLVSPIDDKNALLGYQDTKVRILLKLGRQDEAFEVVSRSPRHADFADLVQTADYKKWQEDGAAKDLLEGRAGETAFEALTRLGEVIARYGHQTYAALIWSEPISPIEVAASEENLGTKLPPSYVSLVTRHGCFKLLWEPPEDPPDKVPGNFAKYRGCRALLRPSEVASESIGTREAYADADDPDTSAMLTDSLLFQENYYRDNFFTFRASAAQAGEMSVHAFYHDDAYGWRDERVGFEEHIRRWVKSVIDDC